MARAPDCAARPCIPSTGRLRARHGPSEAQSAIARRQVDEQIKQDDVGPEPPRQPRPPHL